MAIIFQVRCIIINFFNFEKTFKCSCHRQEDKNSCYTDRCPCYVKQTNCTKLCRCQSNCRMECKRITTACKPCTCGKTKKDGISTYCLRVPEKGRRAKCPCVKSGANCTDDCVCTGCCNGKGPNKEETGKRAERDNFNTYKRKRNSDYLTEKGETPPQGFWTDAETITLHVLMKIARNLNEPSDVLHEMYTSFWKYINEDTGKKFQIRSKTLPQIKGKLAHIGELKYNI